MSMTDPIADMLTRIRNGLQAKHAGSVRVDGQAAADEVDQLEVAEYGVRARFGQADFLQGRFDFSGFDQGLAGELRGLEDHHDADVSGLPHAQKAVSQRRNEDAEQTAGRDEAELLEELRDQQPNVHAQSLAAFARVGVVLAPTIGWASNRGVFRAESNNELRVATPRSDWGFILGVHIRPWR